MKKSKTMIDNPIKTVALDNKIVKKYSQNQKRVKHSILKQMGNGTKILKSKNSESLISLKTKSSNNSSDNLLAINQFEFSKENKREKKISNFHINVKSSIISQQLFVGNKSQLNYYISEVCRDWKQYLKNKNPDKQMQSIFMNHLMHAMSIFKSKKFQSPPMKPHMTIELQELSVFKKTVLFDLDETLVHSQFQENGKYYPFQKQIFVEEKYGQIRSYIVNIRPHAQEVINRLSKSFNLAVFTASDKIYAEKVLQILDPHNNIFKNRFYREHCYQNYNKENIKDLRIFNNEKLDNLVIVDNSPVAYCFQKNNGIPIIPFIEDQKDNQLLKLEKFLYKNIMNSTNTQQVLSQTFKFQKFQNLQTLKQLMNSLYNC